MCLAEPSLTNAKRECVKCQRDLHPYECPSKEGNIRLFVLESEYEKLLDKIKLLEEIRESSIELSWDPDDKDRNKRYKKAELALWNWKQENG